MQIYTEANQKEIKKHGSFDFPVHISRESIHHYDGGAFLWHWHPEIELTWIINGTMDYYVNDRTYQLSAGEGLFCNSNALHSGYQKDRQSCDYLSVTFHPRFIYGYANSLLQTKYVDFITANSQWSSLRLTPDIDWHREIIAMLRNISGISLPQMTDSEMQLHIWLCQIWQRLFHHYFALPTPNYQADTSLNRLKTILSFLQEHYREPLTLEDIAANVNICKNECCRFFKKHMNMTIFEYLMFFRIQQSIASLKDGKTVTEAAAMSGFSDPCYYGKIFKRYMGCSPAQYKKMRGAF